MTPTVGSPQELVLLDLATRQETPLSPDSARPGYHAVSERYVAWTAFTWDPQSQGRDVFVHDLETGVTSHVDDTYAGYQVGVSVDGEFLTWQGSEIDNQPPYHLMLHHLPSGDSTVIVDNDGAVWIGRMHRNLVAYNTTRYTGELQQLPSDVELYDIDSGARRRVTLASGALTAAGIYFPWLMLINYIDFTNTYNPYYFVDLVKTGLTDETGHVLPGDGVVEVPAE